MLKCQDVYCFLAVSHVAVILVLPCFFIHLALFSFPTSFPFVSFTFNRLFVMKGKQGLISMTNYLNNFVLNFMTISLPYTNWIYII